MKVLSTGMQVFNNQLQIYNYIRKYYNIIIIDPNPPACKYHNYFSTNHIAFTMRKSQ